MVFIFSLVPYKLFHSHVNYALIKDFWAHQIYKGTIEISKGPLKLRILHVFEWDMGHWPILRVYHHFGPGLSLTSVTIERMYVNSSNQLITENEWLTIKLHNVVDNV